jgi:hypothetical protein
MSEQTSPELFGVLERLADVVGDTSAQGLEQRMRQMEDDLGPATPTPFLGQPGTELAQAARWMDDADQALLAFTETESRIPALQEAAERYRRESLGKWIALAAVGAILLAILVGQLI